MYGMYFSQFRHALFFQKEKAVNIATLTLEWLASTSDDENYHIVYTVKYMEYMYVHLILLAAVWLSTLDCRCYQVQANVLKVTCKNKRTKSNARKHQQNKAKIKMENV